MQKTPNCNWITVTLTYKSHSPVLVKGPPNLSDNLWDKSMPRLSSSERGRALGQLQAGVNQNVIATTFGVSQQPTISSLCIWYATTGNVRDIPRSGRPRVTSAATDRRIERLVAQRRYVKATLMLMSDNRSGGLTGVLPWLKSSRARVGSSWPERSRRP